ncbi:MAG: nucleoside recognition domain-containing protein [Flavobacteriales bacterium]
MVLSRFWLIIFVSSIFFILVGSLTQKHYSLDFAITGKKDNPIVIKEAYLQDFPKEFRDSLERSETGKIVVDKYRKDVDTTYEVTPLKEGTSVGVAQRLVKITSGKQKVDGMIETAKNTIMDIILPLVATLAFFAGLMQLLVDSGASDRLAKRLSPFFTKIFPSVPENHPSISYMTLNFSANFLGLDSAATPFGLKAMESLQEINPDKNRASDAQIMFLCLHAAGLTLIPTSIIGYRAAAHASNPADVMLPCIITSFIGTLAALLIVAFRQKIKVFSGMVILTLMVILSAITGLLFYIGRLDIIGKNQFTSNFSSILLLGIILIILLYAFLKEKHFTEKQTNIFDSFVVGARNGMNTAVTVFPYILGIMVAISLLRNSGLFELISGGISWLFLQAGVAQDITDSLPVALLRPFSSGGSRGFMLDAMSIHGPDSLTGRLVCIFQCSAETTFYVVALYFGSIRVTNTRYTLATMLLVDLICVFVAIFMGLWFF